LTLNVHDVSLTSYARQDLKQFIHSIFRKAIGSILISRETGVVYHCGTSAPLDERIKEQESIISRAQTTVNL
jgi:hypothetical protein